MQLDQKYIDYLRAVHAGDMDDVDALQQWWDDNYEELRRSVPIWLLLRFRHGWKLCAEATLQEVGVLSRPNAEPVPSIDFASCDTPDQMLPHLRRSVYNHALRRFSVGCCRRQIRWLGDAWRHGIEVAEAYSRDHISRKEWDAEREVLTADFWEVRESDAGEISAAKEAVLAAFDPDAFCSAVISSSASISSVFAETNDEHAITEEEKRQAALLYAEAIRKREQSE